MVRFQAVQPEEDLDQAVLDLVDARVGTVIKNKWHVDALIGTGGMAAVYAATHRNGNRVALKILHTALSVDHSLSRRFKQEGYAANAVQHRGVVRVLDDDITEDGAAFLVMDLLEGETTADRATRLGGRLPLQDVMPIIDGVLDILSTAHAAGIVHRDIKPENIFFTKDRQVRLLDFGIARLRRGQLSPGATAAAMGTPAFMPPEQALGHMDKVDALSDVWATGATMYTLLSGRLVHELETANEVLIAAATRPAPSLALHAPEIPIEIVEVADRALAFDKKNRWSSTRAMQHALRSAGLELSSPWHTNVLVAAAMAEGPGSAPDTSPRAFPVASLEADGSPARETVPGPEARPQPAEAARPEAVTTGAGLGVDVPRAARRRKRLVAMSSALGVALLVGGALGVLAFVRRDGTAPDPGHESVSAANVTQASTPVTTATQAPPEAEPQSDTETNLEMELEDLADASKSTPHAKRRTPKPLHDPPREKSWLDRRK